MSEQTSLTERIMDVLSQLNPEYLDLALRFAVQASSQSTANSSPVSPDTVDKQSH